MEKVDAKKEFKIMGRLKKLPRWARWALAVLLVIITALSILFCINKNKPMAVTVTQIEKQDIKQTVFSNGSLEAVNEQEFFTPVDSTLMELNVELGDRVKKGDVLGRLDTLELGRRYQNALAVLESREAELARAEAVNEQAELKKVKLKFENVQKSNQRTEELFSAGAVSQEEAESSRLLLLEAETAYQEELSRFNKGAASKEIRSLQSQVDLARQEVAQAKERLDLATFVAEIDGVVTMVGARKGNQVMEGTELLIIGDDSELEVNADINEIDAGSLGIGQEAEISCLALAGKEFSGKISRIGDAAVVGMSSAGEMVNVPVVINLRGDIEGLKIGYTVDLLIKTMEEKNAVTIPVEAIIEREDHKFVYVVKEGVLEEREIKTKIGNELNDIVLSGLEAGEEVVINPSPELQNGQKVLVMPKEVKMSD